jgi:hypothetical protein
MHHLYLPLDHSAIQRTTSRGHRNKLTLHGDVLEWLSANVGSERLVRHEGWGEDTWYQVTTVHHKSFEPVHEIMFKYREHAMLFKLTFG